MNDDCTSGARSPTSSSNGYSCDTQTSNNYSCNNNHSSHVEAVNICSAGIKLFSNNESSIKEFDASNARIDEKLQTNNITSDNKYIGIIRNTSNNHFFQDAPQNGNYIRKSDHMGNDHFVSYISSNSNRTRIRQEDLWKNRPRMPTQQNNTRRSLIGMIIVTLVIAFLFIMTVYLIVYANYPSILTREKMSIYKPITMKPLP